MRRDSPEAKRIDRLLSKHGVIAVGATIGRRLEDFSQAQLLGPAEMSEEQEAAYYRELLEIAEHGKPYDTVAVQMLLRGHGSERARTIYKGMPGIRAIPLPRKTVGVANSQAEDDAFKAAERFATKTLPKALDYCAPRPECFAPVFDWVERAYQRAADAAGETSDQLVDSLMVQIVWAWMGGETWWVTPFVGAYESEKAADVEHKKDPRRTEVWNAITTTNLKLMRPPELLNYVQAASLVDLARDAVRAKLMIEGLRREGHEWTDELVDALAFLLGPTLAVQIQHFVDILRAVCESAGLKWDPSVEEELRRTDFDGLLRSYAKGDEPPGS